MTAANVAEKSVLIRYQRRAMRTWHMNTQP